MQKFPFYYAIYDEVVDDDVVEDDITLVINVDFLVNDCIFDYL